MPQVRIDGRVLSEIAATCPYCGTGPVWDFSPNRNSGVQLKRIFSLLVSSHTGVLSHAWQTDLHEQLTLPKALVAAFQGTEDFEVTQENGRLVLTPVQLTCASAVRAKPAELGFSETDVAEAVAWARRA